MSEKSFPRHSRVRVSRDGRPIQANRDVLWIFPD
jgi:hypothetical protein